MAEYCEVAFPVHTRLSFTYRAGPFAGRLSVGQRVRAPLGGREATGFVVALGGQPDVPPGTDIREVLRPIDAETLLNDNLVRLARWLARYYCAGLGETLNLAFNSFLQPPREAAGEEESLYQATLPGIADQPLTPGQQQVFEGIAARLDRPDRPVLLQGVAASGKTEVYLRLARRAADAGRQTLLLVPEIALTAQVSAWAEAAFGPKAAVLHGKLSRRERRVILEQARNGRLSLVIGTRSAVFTPLARTGLIILDEEFDRSFKETRRPRYHAREVAVKRGEIEGALVVLGGATPSLEAWHAARIGRFHRFNLPDRIGNRPAPRVRLADLRAAGGQKRRRPLISEGLRALIEEKLIRREQVIILVNRRGSATYLACLACGRVLRCPTCEVNLVYHRTTGEFYCHYCNRRDRAPEKCPACGAADFTQRSSGLGAVEKELKKLFPAVPVLAVDARTLGRDPVPLEDFRQGRYRILAGTRLIAKGHHFPGVTLAAVIGGDFMLNLPDFRAAEYTFQTLLQLAGRAGRCLPDAEVLVQTCHPEHYALTNLAGFNADAFYETDLSYRAEAGYPPCGHLANVIFSGRKEAAVIRRAEDWGGRLTGAAAGGRVEVLGPAACYHKKIRDFYRWHLMLKAPDHGEIAALLEALPELFSAPGVTLDIDPVDLL